MTNYLDSLDPQFRDFAKNFPKFTLNDETLPMVRQMEASFFKPTDLPDGVTRTNLMVNNPVDGNDVPCVVYRPANEGPLPVYLHFHGGGMVMGGTVNAEARNVRLCSELGILVVSVDYRLAPEHPYPAAIVDGYSTLFHLNEYASELGIDAERIAIGGESAGGGLAASVAIFNSEMRNFKICQQILVYPMLDNRIGLDSYPDQPELGRFCWTREYNTYGWKAYLGEKTGDCSFIPAHVGELHGLPPAWICVGDKDLFLHECREYAERLKAAGNQVDYDEYPGAPHGFYIAAEADISREFEKSYSEKLEAAFK